MWWTSSCGKIELQITKAQAEKGSHSGACDEDIAGLRTVPAIRRQLSKIDRVTLADVLNCYGGWDGEELQDHEQNLSRILWIACGDIVDGNC